MLMLMIVSNNEQKLILSMRKSKKKNNKRFFLKKKKFLQSILKKVFSESIYKNNKMQEQKFSTYFKIKKGSIFNTRTRVKSTNQLTKIQPASQPMDHKQKTNEDILVNSLKKQKHFQSTSTQLNKKQNKLDIKLTTLLHKINSNSSCHSFINQQKQQQNISHHIFHNVKLINAIKTSRQLQKNKNKYLYQNKPKFHFYNNRSNQILINHFIKSGHKWVKQKIWEVNQLNFSALFNRTSSKSVSRELKGKRKIITMNSMT